MQQHCCEIMSFILNEKRVAISYCPVFREYHIDLRNDIAVQRIRHCPWCGMQLSESLRDIFFEITEKYGIEAISDINESTLLPKEFHTDEWWRKRGL